MRSTFVLAPMLALIVAGTASAQVSEPTPTPDPHVYSDPAMTFAAPPDAVLVNRQVMTLGDLSQDLQPVASWLLHAGKENARLIQIEMESYSGAPDQWESQFESQTHGQQDGTLIKGKEPMALLNGMPAYFVEVTYGSGFSAKKMYAVVWADGQRGIVLSETSRLGDATPEEAKNVLKQATATRYPAYQP